MRKLLFGFGLVALLSACGSGNEPVVEAEPDTSEQGLVESEVVTEPEKEIVVAEPEPVPVVEPEVVAEDNGMTNQQRNAVRSAENYISFAGFSRDGLIDQLSSEAGDGYNIDDATIAVDSLDIDYDEQAGRSAENYLSFTGFSCDGLVEQLSSSAGDKYTIEQAEYGAILAGACD